METHPSFDRWLQTFDRYTGNDLLYYNPLGAIPDEAVLAKGERRANAFVERTRFDATEFETGGAEASLVLAEDEGDEEAGERRMSKKELKEAEG